MEPPTTCTSLLARAERKQEPGSSPRERMQSPQRTDPQSQGREASADCKGQQIVTGRTGRHSCRESFGPASVLPWASLYVCGGGEERKGESV